MQTSKADRMTSDQEYTHRIAAWRADRLARLTAEDGWRNIIGRWWLEQHTITIGAADDNDVVLPVGPAYVGTLVVIFVLMRVISPKRVPPSRAAAGVL